jgi:hypothetical protein
MPTSTDMAQIVADLSPVIGLIGVLLGTLLGGWLQARISRKQALQERDNQLKLLTETHRQNMEVLAMQHRREEDLRLRQFAESDRADRLVVIEYVDLVLPRLIEVASIDYIASDNKDAEELRRFKQLQRYMTEMVVDPAHPEKNLGLRTAFLLFQLTAAMRIALNARWTRPLTDEQGVFLSHWESHIEPMICSARYPGKELLYREQIEIITQEMLVAPEVTRIARPVNWSEFCEKYTATAVVRELAEQVAGRVRFIFNESNALPPRKAMQCRLGIMALYMIQLTKEAGNDSWSWRNEGLWKIVAEWFAWEQKQGQNPKWYVFDRGDVAKRIQPGVS